MVILEFVRPVSNGRVNPLRIMEFPMLVLSQTDFWLPIVQPAILSSKPIEN